MINKILILSTIIISIIIISIIIISIIIIIIYNQYNINIYFAYYYAHIITHIK